MNLRVLSIDLRESLERKFREELRRSVALLLETGALPPVVAVDATVADALDNLILRCAKVGADEAVAMDAQIRRDALRASARKRKKSARFAIAAKRKGST